MDEVWERAVETALEGQTDCSSARSLTLDGVVKCLHGRLPPPSLLEKFQALEHLSIANIGLSSLDKFPRLPNLQKLILSDNRIAGGLEFLVEAGLASLRDLDVSNNRIQFVEDLAPLAQLKLVSLDLYECPVTRVKDYRSRVFSMIRSLKYLDKMDADENERPESDEEEDEEDDEEEDPGSGEIDGEDRSGRLSNGRTDEGVLDADEDEESDADEEETAINGSERAPRQLANGLRVAATSANGEEEEEDLGEEIDEDDGEDEDVVEVHEIEDSEEDEDGVEEDEYEDDEDEDEEDVEDEDEDAEERGNTGRLTSTEGEIDGHDQGEEDENREIGEEDEPGIEEEGQYEDGEDEVRSLFSPSFHSSLAIVSFVVPWSRC